MKIGVVGLGYIGSVTAAVLADNGHDVVGVDIDESRISSYNRGDLPLFEPGLSDIMKNNSHRIEFSKQYNALSGCLGVFVCVATPSVDGRINLDYVENACKSIKDTVPDATIIIKSTVVPGTAEAMRLLTGLEVISNPEFTREGTAVKDTKFPDRVIVGARNPEGYELMRSIWSFVKAPFVETTNENAELIKYASNSFLATKISFINEIANLCEKIPNADVTTVALGMGLDPRIGKDFLRAGLGYGGSCFPKDTEALASFARDKGEIVSIVESAIKVNSSREDRVVELCRKSLGETLEGKNICLLGLSFKEDTDDLRESKSLKLLSALEKAGASVKAFDPIIKSDRFSNACDDLTSCLSNTSIAVVSTEWPQFAGLLDKYEGIVLDARRIISPDRVNSYVGVGRFDK